MQDTSKYNNSGCTFRDVFTNTKLQKTVVKDSFSEIIDECNEKDIVSEDILDVINRTSMILEFMFRKLGGKSSSEDIAAAAPEIIDYITSNLQWDNSEYAVYKDYGRSAFLIDAIDAFRSFREDTTDSIAMMEYLKKAEVVLRSSVWVGALAEDLFKNDEEHGIGEEVVSILSGIVNPPVEQEFSYGSQVLLAKTYHDSIWNMVNTDIVNGLFK